MAVSRGGSSAGPQAAPRGGPSPTCGLAGTPCAGRADVSGMRGSSQAPAENQLVARGSLRTWAACLSGPRAPHGQAPPARADSVPPPLLTLCGWQVTRRLASGRPCWPRGAARAAMRGSPRTGDRPSRAYPGAARPTCQARSRRRCGHPSMSRGTSVCRVAPSVPGPPT